MGGCTVHTFSRSTIMGNKLLAFVAVLVALFATTAAPASKVAELGCCPLCK
jgi:hypothetical protein